LHINDDDDDDDDSDDDIAKTTLTLYDPEIAEHTLLTLHTTHEIKHYANAGC